MAGDEMFALQGVLASDVLVMNFCPSVHVHSLNSKTNYLVGDERVTAGDCVHPPKKVDTANI